LFIIFLAVWYPIIYSLLIWECIMSVADLIGLFFTLFFCGPWILYACFSFFVFLMVLVLLALKFCSCSIFSSVSSNQFFLQFWSWISGFDVNGIKESKCNYLVIFVSFLIGMMCTMKIYIFFALSVLFFMQGVLLFFFKPFWRQCFVI